jgi:hypothetical protein
MKYRDDREALRNRAEVLESDLEAAERRLREAEGKLRAHEEKDEREQKELEALRREVERLRPPKPNAAPQARAALIAASAGVVLAGGVVFVVTARSSGEVVEAAPPVAASAVPAVAPTIREGDALFGGLVVAQSAGPAEVGTPCLVHARLSTAQSGIGVENLAVRCGGASVYDATTPIVSGMQSRSGGALELTGANEQHHYLVDFALTGQWQGERPQIELASEAQRARVWRSGLEESSTTLYLDDFSFPRRGPSLDLTFDALQPGASDRRPLALTAKEGAAPETLAPSCELRVHPAPLRAKEGGQSCRVVVHCGGAIVYGGKGQGWNACERRSGGLVASDPTRSDGDGDPSLELDETTVTLADGAGEKAWQATFRIDPSPCLKNGRWRAHGFGDRPRNGTLEVEGSQAQLQWEGADAEMLTIGPCEGDVVSLTQAGAKVYSLALGPGFVSAGGASSTGEPLGLLLER